MLLFFRRPRILDLYVIREILPPTGLGLLVFTFILLLDSIPRLITILVTRGADLTTVVRLFLNLLPSMFAITIPMAFLLGVLLAFGRLASESELVAMKASGVSAASLLRPLLFLCLVTTGATFYVNAIALPAANQTYRELLFSLVISKAREAVRPRVFTQELVPSIVLYASDVASDTGEWRDVLIYDARKPSQPSLSLSRTGKLLIDKERKTVSLSLGEGVRHSTSTTEPTRYEQQRFATLTEPLPFEEFFPKRPLSKGDREMTLGELEAEVARLRSEGGAPKDYNRFEVEWHKKFAIAAACLVFGLLGLALSLGSKKEARSAAFGLAIVVIAVYYVFIRMGEQAGDTGLMPPWLAMWGANLVLGGMAIGLLVLNQKMAAFDPLDAQEYLALLPSMRRAEPAAAPTTAAPLRRGRRPRTAVVVRIPRIGLAFPTLLDRYIGRSYVGYFLLVLAAFSVLIALGELVDLFDDVQHNAVKLSVVVHYYVYHLPWITHLLAPLAALVGVLATFGVLSRRNEVTAMKAGGVSLYRAAVPVVLVAALFTFGLYVAQEIILPHTNRIARMDFNVIKGRPPQSSSLLELRWILGSDGRFYNYDHLTERTRPVGVAEGTVRADFSFFGLRVYDIDPKTWELRDILFASQAAWTGPGRGYALERGWRRAILPQAAFRTFDIARTRDLESPDYFSREGRPSDAMTFPELRTYIASVQALGFDTLKLEVQLWHKLAFPLTAVVMTLLGIPFAFVVARRGALYGIALSILIAIVYITAMETFQALGENAILPPFLAAWAPNLIFGAAGLYLMLTLDT